MQKGLHKYIGSRKFYASVMAIAIPIIIQNIITNFVNMLDNVMVGQIGTAEMSGVAIINQLIFVFNLCVFGATAGAGIFTAQFAGSKDTRNIRHTLRFKLLTVIILTVIGVSILLLLQEPLINLYLKGEGSLDMATQFMFFGKQYLSVILFGLLPFALSNAYASTLRETGNTFIPMVAGLVAVIVNLALNYILIFGHFGAPVMGVRGAALATVISRFVELGIVAGWAHTHADDTPYIVGLFKGFSVPIPLCKSIIVKGLPLLINEALWSIGITVQNQCYSVRSLDVVSAINIQLAIWTVFSVCFLTMGTVVGIMMGQHLGAGDSREEIIDLNRKLSVFSVLFCFVFALGLASISGIFPMVYNTTQSVRSLATAFIIIGACMMPFNSYTNACYFTLRSGGKTFITFLFDSCFIWVVCVPLAWALANLTTLHVILVYLLVNATELIKCIIGYVMIKSGNWIQNLSNVK